MNGQNFYRNNQVEALRQELSLLRSLVMSVIVKDAEGEYRPAFVRRILKLLQEKPNSKFIGKETFLEQLKRHV